MADLNTCTYLGFSIRNEIQKSGGLVVCMWLTVASVRKNELFRIQLDKTKNYI